MSATGYTTANITLSNATTPSSWECHRCGTVNAPHVSQCTCPRLGTAPLVGIPWGEPYAPQIPTDPLVGPGIGPWWGGVQYTQCATATIGGVSTIAGSVSTITGSIGTVPLDLVPGACALNSVASGAE